MPVLVNRDREVERNRERGRETERERGIVRGGIIKYFLCV